MGAPDSLALPPGADPRQLTRHLGQLHDSFVSSGAVDPALRSVVSESWRRSVRSGVDPERSLARLPLDDARLADARTTHPLAIGMPVIRRLRVDEAAEAGLLVAVSCCGSRAIRSCGPGPRTSTSSPVRTGARSPPAPTPPAPPWPSAARCRSSAPSTCSGR